MTKRRIAMNLLWCLVALFAILCLPIIRRGWYEQRRDEIADQRAVEFARYSAAEWARVGEDCRAYWQFAKDLKDEFAAKPPLPTLLDKLTCRYLEIKSEGFTLYWSDGFFGNGSVSLTYCVTSPNEKLFLTCAGQIPFKKEVWKGSEPSQR